MRLKCPVALVCEIRTTQHEMCYSSSFPLFGNAGLAVYTYV